MGVENTGKMDFENMLDVKLAAFLRESIDMCAAGGRRWEIK